MVGVSLIIKDGMKWLPVVERDLMASDLASFSHVKVAVDNGSTDGTADWLERHGWIVLRNPTNVGIVAARNQTFWRLAAERVDFVLEIHADMRFPKQWLTPLVAAMSDPDVYIACPEIVTRWDEDLDIATASSEHIEALCASKRDGKIPNNLWTAKYNHPCLHRMAPFQARGFYDDRYLWQEFEDTDLYYDYKFRQGKKVVVVKGSAVYHYCAGQRLEICTTAHGQANEAYFKQKFGLSDNYFPMLWELQDHPYVILSGCEIDNSGGGQTPTKLALELLRAGHHVVFVQQNPSVVQYVHPALRVVTYRDFCGHGLWDGVNIDQLGPAMKNWLAENGYGHTGGQIVAMNPIALCRAIAQEAKAWYWKVAYWSLDDWTSFKSTGDAHWFYPGHEDWLLEHADTLLAVSEPLRADMASRSGRHVVTIPNGYDTRHFGDGVVPRDLGAAEAHVGYWGSLWGQWFDWELLVYLATARPSWKFHMIGSLSDAPTSSLIDAARSLENVIFYGELQGFELSRYGASFDVGIIPFKDNAVTWAVSPIKGYEYLASGIPVVSRPMGALVDIPWVFQARRHEDFLTSIETALSSSRPHDLSSWLEGATWTARAKDFLAATNKEI